MRKLELVVSAGSHDRANCPMQFRLSEAHLDGVQSFGKCVGLLDSNGQSVPCQCAKTEDGGIEISWILQKLDKGAQTTFTLMFGCSDECCCATQSAVTLDRNTEGEIKVFVAGDYFTTYDYRYAKPCLGPIVGPYGDWVTRYEPEHREHPHQRSLWFAHGDINGIDAWNEPAGTHGKVVVDEFSATNDGPVYARIDSKNTWTDFDGKPLVGDVRSVKVYNLPKDGRIIDKTITYVAGYGKVVLGPTKEAGPLGVRVAPSMIVPNGGRIENAYGGINERETWGRRSPWCDYSGTVNGNVVGIAAFDHPENYGYPTYWHVRNYGLMAGNNFFFSGPMTIEKGEQVTFSYRVYIHSGDATTGKVSDKYHDYINPPEVKVSEE